MSAGTLPKRGNPEARETKARHCPVWMRRGCAGPPGGSSGGSAALIGLINLTVSGGDLGVRCALRRALWSLAHRLSVGTVGKALCFRLGSLELTKTFPRFFFVLLCGRDPDYSIRRVGGPICIRCDSGKCRVEYSWRLILCLTLQRAGTNSCAIYFPVSA